MVEFHKECYDNLDCINFTSKEETEERESYCEFQNIRCLSFNS